MADGIAEEILNLLSKATTLRVIARTSSFSFRGKDADVRRIAEALGVTHVLEGSVRKEGDRIRVTVRLVDASDGSRLWSESYDQGVGDILALQTDVARSVAAALKANLQNDVADVASQRSERQKRTICICVVSRSFDVYGTFGEAAELLRTGDRDRPRIHSWVLRPRCGVRPGRSSTVKCRHGREPSKSCARLFGRGLRLAPG